MSSHEQNPDSLRSVLLASWRRAAADLSREDPTQLTLSAPSVAGMYLDTANGNANLALARIPYTNGPVWGRVAKLLMEVEAETPETILAKTSNVVPFRR